MAGLLAGLRPQGEWLGILAGVTTIPPQQALRVLSGRWCTARSPIHPKRGKVFPFRFLAATLGGVEFRPLYSPIFLPCGKYEMSKIDCLLASVQPREQELTLYVESLASAEREIVINKAKALGLNVSGTYCWLLVRKL